VPLKEDIAVYFEREVKPHVPDAWMPGISVQDSKAVVIDESKAKPGYEISFNRYFFTFTPPRSLHDIDTDLQRAEDEVLRLLREVVA